MTGAADCTLNVVPLALSEPPATELRPPTAQCTIPLTSEASGSGGLSSVCVRPDGKLLASGGWDRRVRVWQWKRLKPLAVLQLHKATVNAVSFSSCSRWLASASADKTIAIWSIYSPGDAA